MHISILFVTPIITYQTTNPTTEKLTLSLLFSQHLAAYLWVDTVSSLAVKGAFYQLDNWGDASFIETFLDTCVGSVSKEQPVQVCFDAPQLSMIPIAQYDRAKLDLLHKSSFPFDPSTMLLHESFSAWQFYLGYAVPTALFRALESRYSDMKYRHAVKLALRDHSTDEVQGALFVQVGITQLTVVLCRGGRLLFCGSFSYQTEMDALYYLIRLSEAHALSRENLQVFYSGLVDPSSRLQQELSNYFLNLNTVSSAIQFADQSPLPLYFTLLSNNSLCVS